MATLQCIAFVAVALWQQNVSAQTLYLTNQHVDLRLQYDGAATGSNQLDVILEYDQGQQAINSQVYIVGNTNAKLTIPSNPNFAFLGPAGAPIWILPQSQNSALPFLGVSAEDIPLGVFDGAVDLELRSVEGPGNFFVWAVSGPGQPPIVKMIYTNGVVNQTFNKTSPLVGSHEHCNWGFSTNGHYNITFRCVGRLAADSSTLVGKDVTWSFLILPLRPWEQWVSTNWPPATPRAIAGPAADPEGDGIVNVMEYALGLNPNAPSLSGLPTASIVTEEPNQFGALTFTRVKSATDLVYLPSGRGALNGGVWDPLTNNVSVVDQGATETVTVRDHQPLSAAPQRFQQLRVQWNYP